MITAPRVVSMRRHGSSSQVWEEAALAQLGDVDLHVPGRGGQPLGPCPLRCAVRESSLTTSLADILAAALQELIEEKLTGRTGTDHGARVTSRLGSNELSLHRTQGWPILTN
jgi:hypothetical protein